MAYRSRSSDLEDPLQFYSGLSLFPRTLKSLSNPLPPPREYQSDDLHQTHSIMDSMPLNYKSEQLEQAKAILDSSSEHLNPGIPANVVPEDESHGIEKNPFASQRERRQGLGRKRARFSLKPTASQPIPNFGPSFDDSKYQNPEDFFAAYEKFENAKREWEKQTGTGLTDTHQNQPAARPRRPGISGRRRVSYNHRYSADAAQLEDSAGEIDGLFEQSSQKNNTASVTAVDRESTDPTTETATNVDSILGELLSCSAELAGDVNLLEERLQIKPIDTEKLALPELQDVRKSDFLASQKVSSKPRTVFSDIRNMLKGIRSASAQKSALASSPLKSPGQLLALRKQHISPSNLLDQFSFPDRNHLLPGDMSTEALSKQSSEADAAKVSSVSGVASGPVNKSTGNTSGELESDTRTDISRSVSSPVERTVGSGMDDSVTGITSIRSKLNIDMQAEGNDGGIPIRESDTHRDLGRSENDVDTCVGEGNQLDGLAEDSFREATIRDEYPKSPKGAGEECNKGDGSAEYAENLQDHHGEQNEFAESAHGLQNENAQQEEVHNSTEEQMEKRGKRVSREKKGKKRSKMASGEGEGNKRTKTSSREGGRTERIERVSRENNENKQRKTVSRESKVFSRRKSLAAAGTKWESGVRRSTRIKSRPLEYWRGEKFLYGRIHGSLATVIGVRYESPTGKKEEREKPRLKVKAYVSDEYKKHVEGAALH